MTYDHSTLQASEVSAPPVGRRPAVSVLVAALQSMRPYQWLKNLLVFVPLAAAHLLGDLQLLKDGTRAFIAFSLCASAIYLINDLKDAPADRLHPHKADRPIASKRLPSAYAVLLVPVLLAGAVAISWPLPGCAAAIGLYFGLMVTYTLWLKSIVLLDSFVLAGGYALRVLAGGFAVGIQPSPHLLAFCIFLFLSLALVKRYAELSLLRVRDGLNTHARGYFLADQELIAALGISCGSLSVLVLALYMSKQHIDLLYSRSEFIWPTCILLLYWIAHVWLSAHRGQMTDDPLVFALKDRTSRILILLMGISAGLAV